MLYFSELRGKQVLAGQISVGSLDDIVFKVSPAAPVTKLFVKKPNGQKIFIPYSDVGRIGRRIHIDVNHTQSELEENELFVGKNISDQQIIDITGSNIIRVNDVVFMQQPNLHISGVDVGSLGILRWFGLEEIVSRIARMIHIQIVPKFLAWTDVAPVELARGRVVMKQADVKLKRLKPEDLAGHLDRTNIRNVKRIVSLFDDEYTAQILKNLTGLTQTQLIKSFSAERAAKVLSLLETNEAVDILLTLSRHERDKIITLLTSQDQHEVKRLMGLAKTPVGNVVSNEYLVVKPHAIASEVTELVRKSAIDIDDLLCVYVINNDSQVIGVFSLYELITQSTDRPVYKFMIQNPVVVHLTTPKEIVIRRMVKYKLHTIPVVTEKGHMLGVVRLDDLLDEQTAGF